MLITLIYYELGKMLKTTLESSLDDLKFAFERIMFSRKKLLGVTKKLATIL